MSKPSVDPLYTNLHKGNAYWMARFSSEVYKRKNDGKPDTDAILESLKSDDSDFCSVIGFNKRSAQAVLIEHKNYLCIAFRGTETEDILDHIWACPVNKLFGRFHKGYWHEVDAVWGKINREYEKLQANKENKKPLLITGHSLGGAMATIAAARFICENVEDNKILTSLYTFGQPRAMDISTAPKYDSKISDRYHRFHNYGDMVPTIPNRSTGYSHAGKCVFIHQAGKIQVGQSFCIEFINDIEFQDEDDVEDLIEPKGDFLGSKYHAIKAYLKLIEKWEMANNTYLPTSKPKVLSPKYKLRIEKLQILAYVSFLVVSEKDDRKIFAEVYKKVNEIKADIESNGTADSKELLPAFDRLIQNIHDELKKYNHLQQN